MSLTYITSIVQFLVVLGILSQAEAQTVADGAVAITSLIVLGMALHARYRVGGLTILGFRK